MSAGASGGAGPHQVKVELTRQSHADEPYAFQLGRQIYSNPAALGGVRVAEFEWSEALMGQLAALAKGEADPALRSAIGRQLGEFLEQLGVLGDRERVAAAVQAQRRVMVNLRFNAAELYALPWELAQPDAGSPPLGSLDRLLFRYAWPGTRAHAPTTEPRPEGGDLLFAWSAAGGAVPHEAHEEALRVAWSVGVGPEVAQMSALGDATLEGVTARLEAAERAGAPITMLHLLCHGVQRGQSASLLLGARGAEEWVDAQALAQALDRFAGTLRFVVICACQSGDAGGPCTQLPGVAQALHVAGLQSVVASRFPLSKVGSVVLAEVLWRSLLVELSSLEDAVLAVTRALEARGRGLDWAAVQLYARAEDGDDTRPFVFRPYRGLLSFGLEHHRFYFGRSQEVRELLQDLNALRQSGRPRFLVVAGASGTGKSSLALSGLNAALTTRFGVSGSSDGGEGKEHTAQQLRDMLNQLGGLSEALPGEVVREVSGGLSRALALLETSGHGWQIVPMKPGRAPLRSLDAALKRREVAGSLILVVDQLEEIFHEEVSESERGAFGRRLWSLAQDDRCSYVICTIRVDDLGHCSAIELDDAGTRLDKVAYDERHRVFVAQMTRVQLAQVITRPAERVGLRVDPELVKRILDDLNELPNSLPLLAYTLDLLWRMRSGGALTQRAYGEIDGVGGALRVEAERTWEGLQPVEQRVARHVLVRLVAPDGQHRQRGVLSALRPTEPALAQRFEAVVERLVSARLLYRSERRDEVTLEVAHEALIRRWSRLRTWLREDQGMLAQLEEVERWAQEFEVHGEGLDISRFSIAQAVQGRFPGQLSEAALAMLSASEAAAKRRSRRFWFTLVTLWAAGGLVVVVAAAGWWLSASDAVRARDAISLSEARALAAQAPEEDLWPTEGVDGGARERAAALLLDANAPAQTRGWDTLATTLLGPGVGARRLLCAPRAAPLCAGEGCPPEPEPACATPCWSQLSATALRPHREELAIADALGAVQLLGLKEEACPTLLAPAGGGSARALAFAASGERLAVARGEELVLIDLTENSSPLILPLDGEATRWLGPASSGQAWSLVAQRGGAPALLRCDAGGCQSAGPEAVEGSWEVLDHHAPSGRLLVRGPGCAPGVAPSPCAGEAGVEVWSTEGRLALPLDADEVPLHGALGPAPTVVVAATPERVEGDIEAPLVIAKVLFAGLRSSFLYDGEAVTAAWVRSHALDAVAQEVVFAPGGERFAERGADGVLRLRDSSGELSLFLPSQTPDPLERLHGLRGARAGSVTFSGDGQRLAALYPGAVEDEVIVRVWDVAAADEGRVASPGYALTLSGAPLSAYKHLQLGGEGRWASVARDGDEVLALPLPEVPLRAALEAHAPACVDVETYAALGTPHFRGLAKRCACLSAQSADLTASEQEACSSWVAGAGRWAERLRTLHWEL